MEEKEVHSKMRRKSKETSSDNHSTCSTAPVNQRKRGLARFSLRRLLYSSPLVARRVNYNRTFSGSSRSKSTSSSTAADKGHSSTRDVERGGDAVSSSQTQTELKRMASKTSVVAASTASKVSQSE